MQPSEDFSRWLFACCAFNIDATYALLKSEGSVLIEDQPVFLNFWARGCKFFNLLGPDGERLEFCQIL